MTFKIDNDALKRAIMRHYEEQMGQEIREFFAMHAPKELNHIWQLYMEEIQRQEKRQAVHEANAVKALVVIVGIAIGTYIVMRALWGL